MYKIAKDDQEAFKIQDKMEGKPHCWVQWKGTAVCMDFHCKCGAYSHIDADFAYNVRCWKCGTIYNCNGHIELVEIKEAPKCMIIETEEFEEYTGFGS